MKYTPQQYAQTLRSLIKEAEPRKEREMIRAFLNTLASHGSLSLLPDIVRAVEQIQREEGNVREISVRTPERENELSIRRKLHFPPAPGCGRAGKADLSLIKDVRVRGGAIVESEGLRVDNSVAMRLARLQAALCA